jgi:release factor glutamine methyltransferase
VTLDAAGTIAAARKALTDTFRHAGIESPDADARLLIAEALDIGRTELMVNGDRAITKDQVKAIQSLAQRRLAREPVARILGRKEFWSLPLDITADVLVPRPETETIVEAALDFVVRGGLRMEKLRILDIGTGSGALILALLHELAQAQGTATDISAAALAVARANAEKLDLASRCAFVQCNIADGVSGPFDLIVSNPPYIARADIAGLEPEVREYDPVLALDGGSDGLDAYRAIAHEATRLLAPGGRLFVELGAGQEQAVAALCADVGLKILAIRADLAGIPRALSAAPRNDVKSGGRGGMTLRIAAG